MSGFDQAKEHLANGRDGDFKAAVGQHWLGKNALPAQKIGRLRIGLQLEAGA